MKSHENGRCWLQFKYRSTLQVQTNKLVGSNSRKRKLIIAKNYVNIKYRKIISFGMNYKPYHTYTHTHWYSGKQRAHFKLYEGTNKFPTE